MKTAEILSVIDKYINKYNSEKSQKYETIYMLPSSDAAMLGPDFVRDDASRVAFCFYRLSPKEYDNGGAQSFADATFHNGDSLKNGKIKLELNVNMPVRVDGDKTYLDRPMMAELVTHELTHAYRKSRELAAGHYKFDFSFLNFVKRKKSNKKYTIFQRYNSYDKTMPTGGADNIYEKMRWVGYALVEDEAYAQLAGIKTFLAAGGNIKDSRGKLLIDTVSTYLDEIEKTATPDDWQKCMKTISYIPARQGETPARFARRWIAYYRDRITKFNARVEKMLNKHRTDKLKNATKSLMIADMIPAKVQERD
jgi:hypothetical protein